MNAFHCCMIKTFWEYYPKITLAQVKFEDATAKLTIDFNLSCKNLFSFSRERKISRTVMQSLIACLPLDYQDYSWYRIAKSDVYTLSWCYFVQIENGNGTRCSEVNGVTVCGEYNLSEEFFDECSDPGSEYYFVRDRVRGTLNTPEVS